MRLSTFTGSKSGKRLSYKTAVARFDPGGWLGGVFFIRFFDSPNSNSFTSLAAFSPSARSDLSIFFDRSTASFSPELIVHPIADGRHKGNRNGRDNRSAAKRSNGSRLRFAYSDRQSGRPSNYRTRERTS